MSSWVVPAGGIGSANFTNTGLGYDGTNLLIGDFTNGRIVVATKAGAYVSEIVLASAPASSVQGVAYDTSDGSYWVGHYAATNGTIRRYNSSGVLQQTISPGIGNDGPNGIAYDAANDRILACWTNGVIRGYDCATGTLAETITLSGFQGTRCDGIALDPSTPSTKLWVSSEAASEFGQAWIQQAVRSTGVCSGAFSVPTSVEGFVFQGSDLYVCCDQGFHLSVTNGNRVWKLNATTGANSDGIASAVRSGSFDLRTTAGKQEVSGLGFRPAFVVFFGAQGTSGGTSLEHFGVLDSSGNQWAQSTRQNDNVNPTQGVKLFDSAYCIAYCNTDGTTATNLTNAEGTFTHDGFALNVANDSSARRMHWLAVGGDSVSAKAGKFDLTTSSGTQAVTGVGFQPSAVLFAANTSNTTEGPTATEVRFGLGAMTASAQWALTSFAGDNTSPSQTSGVAITTAAYVRANALPSSLTGVGSYSAFGSDGFTLNKTTPPGATVRLGYLAIGGSIPVAVGAFNQPTSTGNQSVSGLGFSPKAELFFSAGRAASTSVTAHARSMIGAAVSSSNRRTYAATSENGVNPSNTARDVSEALCLTAISDGGTPTRLAAADFVSQDSDGFTVNWTTADATARQNFYLAFGEAPATFQAAWARGSNTVLRG
jgi:hypothetical protein